MKKYLLLTAQLFFFYCAINAQNGRSGVSLWNQHLINRVATADRLEIIVKGKQSDIQALCKKYQATFLYTISDLSRVSIAKKDVVNFAKESSVLRMGDFSRGGQTFLDTARIWNNVDSAYAGYAPLTQSYNGDGVVFGLIDDGIYFKHPDFKNADSSTRIKFLWDQNYSSSVLSPLPYNYGKEWNFMDINNGICTHVEQGSAGHGTHVAGIAVGNGNYNANFRGNAPRCDIVAVSIKYGVNFLANVVDAVDYIYKKADAMGKPCVINTSLGDYYGSHDGNDLTSKAISYLLDEKPGRIIVAAAGNAGNIPFHAQYNFFGTDTLFSCFNTIAYSGKYYVDFWADTQSFKNAYFTVGAVDSGTYKQAGNTGYLNIKRDMPTLAFIGSLTMTRNIIDSLGIYRGQVKYAVQLDDTRYHVECEITPDVTTKNWSLKFCGQGKADVWAEKSLVGTSNFASDSSLRSMTNYVSPDFNQTIVSSWQCNDNVITVGNYVNRNAFLNYDSAYTSNTETAGRIAQNSSWGPTRDGRIKPDISAPGNFILSCMNIRWFSALLSTGQSYKVAYGGYYVRNSGTSMASPMVAGAVALLLQKYPTLKPQQAKAILFRTARIDSFTTNSIPNINYGYGKLNTFQSLIYPAVFGCTDTSSFNYNAAANISNDSCVAKVYGCMDSTALNYNPLANTISSTDTCVYAVIGGLLDPSETFLVSVFPNPAIDNVHFVLPSSRMLSKVLDVFDVNGRPILHEVIAASRSSYTWNCTSIAAGVYIYRIRMGSKSSSGRVIIIK